MILATHISIALISILASTATLVWPSQAKLKVSWALVALTLLSGVLLIALTHSNVLHVCLMGLFYTALVSSGLLVAKRRLVAAQSRVRER